MQSQVGPIPSAGKPRAKNLLCKVKPLTQLAKWFHRTVLQVQGKGITAEKREGRRYVDNMEKGQQFIFLVILLFFASHYINKQNGAEVGIEQILGKLRGKDQSPLQLLQCQKAPKEVCSEVDRSGCTILLPLTSKSQQLSLFYKSVCIQSKNKQKCFLPYRKKKHPTDNDLQLRFYQTGCSFTGKRKVPSLGC